MNIHGIRSFAALGLAALLASLALFGLAVRFF